ncbi:hypothetical protein C7453_102492 [Gluconacetobacter liquefaciens]|uniref:Uncharacterized protein n=1 Tax=Gluconacetobacter liquefaciens TaxID=89584 RepID=A0A370G7C5_GLULI|nr:hypothetical protein C7453_102492 [Gluconacetobacter liquefaciens]
MAYGPDRHEAMDAVQPSGFFCRTIEEREKRSCVLFAWVKPMVNAHKYCICTDIIM